ncbi:MAG: peptidylprolyl isomerase [Flavobacteriales bacterium]|jgi:peptidyl-prolyl cis-trans isomerase SurA
MKNIFLFILALGLTFNLFGQTDAIIMEIDGKPVTKSEFLQIYLKNNNDPKYDKETMDEYMELFRKFKLKVAEAEALGYDTVPRLKKELEGYRKQLATPYLTDSSMNQIMVKESYDRVSEEIRASHILLRLNPDVIPKDTLLAYNRLIKMRKEIMDGKDFEMVAKGKSGSEDPSVKDNGGDLGYFTAFQMVTPFEDAAYTTPIGEVSMPIRTKFGYHIIQVVDKRPARGTITAAHIMVTKGDNSGAEEEGSSASAKKKIDEIYMRLKNGEDFEGLAKQFSDDPSTNSKGGVLPTFGSGTTTRMVTNFEDAAFSIQEDGGICEPIQTQYGWHIIKRLNLVPLASFDKMKKELENRVSRDDRAKRTQDSFVKKLKQDYSYKAKSVRRVNYFKNVIDSTYFAGEFKADQVKKNKLLYKIDGQKIRQSEFAGFLAKTYRTQPQQSVETLVDNQYKEFEKSQILGYEESKLEMKYPAFKSLMQEYHDGILLYEVMSDKVWNKGMKDTTGLKTFFENNREDYMWGARYDAMVYECLNMDVAKQVSDMTKNDTITSKHVIDKINAESQLNLSVKTNKFEVDKTPFLTNANLKKGINPVYSFEEKYYVVKVENILPAGMKELNETRGAVTSDYQNYLEKEWLMEIEKKHPVIIYTEVLYNLNK